VARVRKLLVFVITVVTTGYLLHKVYSEAELVRRNIVSFSFYYLLFAIVLGIFGYIVYTVLWYIYLSALGEVSFFRVLEANLVGTYLSFSLNAAVGTFIKVKLVGAKYFEVLATGLMEISTEFFSASVLLLLLGDWKALPVFLFFLVAFLCDTVLYRPIRRISEIARCSKPVEEFYFGWHRAKRDRRTLLLGFFVGFFLVLINSGILLFLGKSFHVRLSLIQAIEAVLYSEFLGSALGTPGGVGGNELGVIMAIGSGGVEALVAFLYKVINQYSFALLGAITFYRMSSKL